ncbi:MAG: ABC transporter permease subunit, partial [Thermofilaceae archaeon]
MIPIFYLLECAAASIARMFTAYVASLVVALLIGVAMARSKLLEHFLLPVLDILQSIPILGFFPAALSFFVTMFPGSIGPEVAAIFLIMTSLLWNMIFGVYTSVKTMNPTFFDLADVFRFRASARFFHIYVPAASNALVANSLVSWSNGWFFLTSSELISLGTAEYRLKGLGTFVIEMYEAGDYASFYSGVAALLLVISATYFLIWNPAYTVASKRQLPGILATYSIATYVVNRLWMKLEDLTLSIEKYIRMPKTAAKALAAITFFIMAITLLARAASVKLLTLDKLTSNAIAILGVLPVSTLRVTFILLLSFILVVALAYVSHRHVVAGKGIVLIGEILASIPAVIWWPLLSAIAISHALGPYVVATVVMLQGSLWYLYFNVL